MISSLADLDRVTAAGILARAALSIFDAANPAATPVLSNEQALRAKVIREALSSYGISDHSNDWRERLSDALDAESDALLGPVDDKSALERQALKGDLPSDLYKVIIAPQIAECYGRKFPEEERNIELTVHSPDMEQHYGPPMKPGEPHLISLFAKTFANQFPGRSYLMLVAGERNGLALTVFQAWRLYPEDINLVGAENPLEMLRRFAFAFGHDVTVGDQTGRFIFQVDIPGGRVPVKGVIPPVPGKTRREINVTIFSQKTNNGTRAVLVVGIDLDKYREALHKHGW